MGTVAADRMTVSDFLELPERMDLRRELHEGELFELTKPAIKHWRIQRSLFLLLYPIAKDKGEFGVEFSFCPLPEHSVWAADLGFMLQHRVPTTEVLFFPGSPDLVIEVESPSNTAREYAKRQRVCFQTGTQEFWIVYPEDKEVQVTTVDGRVRVFGVEDTIETPLLPELKLAVAAIFKEQ